MSDYAITNILQNARDGVTKAIMTINYAHHEIHSGSAYYVEGKTTLTDTEQFTVKFTPPNSTKRCHFEWSIEGSGENEILLYEDAVGGMAGGSPAVILNNDRESTKTSSMAFATGVTTSTAVGARLHDWLSGDEGAKPNSGATPAESNRANEILLKRNSTYLGIVISNSTQNLSFRAYWYEHAPHTGLKVAK